MLEPAVANLFLVRTRPSRWGRFRGQGRYYRRVLREAQAFAPDLGEGSWYDHWHYHADWPGYGDYGWRDRRSHLMAHCAVFSNFACSLTDGYYQPYQLWLYLSRGDAGQDAVYFHTPIPNVDGGRFPAQLSDVTWGLLALEQYLAELLSMPMRAGIAAGPDQQTTGYFVYSPLYGVSLE